MATSTKQTPSSTCPQRMYGPQVYFSRTYLDEEICEQNYAGKGSADDPYIIDFLENDWQDALNLPVRHKWFITILQTFSTFVVTFASSAYSGGLNRVEEEFDVSEEVAVLGLSLFVLGFAMGPLIWAPLSEIYGRQPTFDISFMGFTAFSVAAACSPNIQSLLILRFFASAFGASAITNSGAIVADIFSKEHRGLATGLIFAAPFMGPALGPIAGGFLGETQGWRWILGLIAIMAGVSWIITSPTLRETYAPVIMRARARALSEKTGKVYLSRLDAGRPPKSLWRELSLGLSRPWILLFYEPTVLLTSLYMSVVYGTLYMLFDAIPLVFEGTRGWNSGVAELPFVGVAIGVLLAMVVVGADDKIYKRRSAALAAEGIVIEPEARLTTAMLGSIIVPVGLFLFAWTSYPWVFWIAPIIGALLFACGLVLVFISQINYLIDSYTIYAASVLAVGSVSRSLFGCAFPLFTTQMYDALGDEWATSIPAFVMVACIPIPFLFYKYGPKIRAKCKFASEAARMLELARRRQGAATESVPSPKEETAENIV